MAIYIAEFVFYEKHLKHTAITIAEEGVIVACSTKYDDFFHILR